MKTTTQKVETQKAYLSDAAAIAAKVVAKDENSSVYRLRFHSNGIDINAGREERTWGDANINFSFEGLDEKTPIVDYYINHASSWKSAEEAWKHSLALKIASLICYELETQLGLKARK